MLEWTVKLPFEILIFPQFWAQECFPFYIEADGPLTCSIFYSCWRTYRIMEIGAHLAAHIFPQTGVWGIFVSHALAFDLRLNQGILCIGCFVWIRVIANFHLWTWKQKHFTNGSCSSLWGCFINIRSKGWSSSGQIMICSSVSVSELQWFT